MFNIDILYNCFFMFCCKIGTNLQRTTHIRSRASTARDAWKGLVTRNRCHGTVFLTGIGNADKMGFIMRYLFISVSCQIHECLAGKFKFTRRKSALSLR